MVNAQGHKMNGRILMGKCYLAAGSLGVLILSGCGGSGSGSTNTPAATGGGGLNGNNSLAQRSLPAIYATGKAVNYGPNRKLGPGVEFPSDANLLQDLGLLHSAGFNLLRLFAADTVSIRIIDLASKNYPDIKFQLGVWIAGTNSACMDGNGANTAQIVAAAALANSYSNVVAVSIGNETSLTNNVPVNCLSAYVTSVKKNVLQPITADDDFAFFAGVAGNGEKPDAILPLLDFVAMHTYPFSNYSSWNWQELQITPPGPLRASQMMKDAVAWAQGTYTMVSNYAYTDAAGHRTTIGASLPIVIGETGWKARQTNVASAIETYAATPTNAKWYYDLLNAWRAGGGAAPLAIFYFEAFDETWKQSDDGWGFWDVNRTPRYILCGTASDGQTPACTTPVYADAGYFPL